VRVLIACECSGVVRRAFRANGHDAWSCDILPAVDGREFHFQCDALAIIASEKFDLLIGHPPCDYLTNSAEWAYGDGPYHQKVKPETLVGASRREARKRAVEFFLALWNCGIPKICLENPIGHMNALMDVRPQIIQPHQFREDASKATCLWLRGLPPLMHTGDFPPRIVEWPRGSGRMVKRWSNQTDSGQNRLPPTKDRASIRSVTYQGIADAMADQWGKCK
jgi:hypothetical protein